MTKAPWRVKGRPRVGEGTWTSFSKNRTSLGLPWLLTMMTCAAKNQGLEENNNTRQCFELSKRTLTPLIMANRSTRTDRHAPRSTMMTAFTMLRTSPTPPPRWAGVAYLGPSNRPAPARIPSPHRPRRKTMPLHECLFAFQNKR